MKQAIAAIFLALFAAAASALAEDSEAIALPSLANLPVACVEEVAPSTDTSHYQSSLAAISASSPLTKNNLYDWMYVRAAKTKEDKVAAVYDAADLYDMSPAVLAGAMLQESIFDNLPLSSDFGNWACGMGQINVGDWCNWGRSLSQAEKTKLDWPQVLEDAVEAKNPDIDICDESFLRPDFAKPFLNVLTARLSKLHPGEPEFTLDASYATNPTRIQYSDVQAGFDAILAAYLGEKDDDGIDKTNTPQAANTLRFELTRNFIENCLNEKYAVAALALNLKLIFDDLPKEIREAQRYHSEKEKKTVCQRVPKSNAYPLQVGWLLADAVYNAGDEILPGVYAYQRHHHIPWENFSPQNLIEAIDYSLTLKHSGISAIGKKEALHHIHGVVSDVTLPGHIIVK